MKRVTFALLALILLTACAPQLTDIAVPASTATSTATATVMPTATPAPTATATASPTPTATATPAVISLPVRNGTPVPNLPYEVITAENVHRLREVARYGYPRLLEGRPYRLTADGKTIVVGTTAGIEFYDAGTQRKTGGFEVDFLRSFDVTPDGRFVLTLAGESLTVWTAEGEKVREFDVQTGDAWALNAVALSPDGSMLAVQRKKADWQEADKLDVYRVSDGSLLDTVRGTGALFSPDGKYLATAFDGSILLYPAGELGQGWEKRLPKQSLPWCGGGDTCGLTFSPNGTLAAVVSKARVDVYQVETRRLVRQVSGWSGDSLPSVLFSPDDGQVVIESMPIWQGTEIQTPARVIVVDISSGEWLMDEEAPEGFVWFDGEKAQTFTWKAEGEIGELIGVGDDGSVRYRPKECVAVDESLNCYTLLQSNQSKNGWQLLKNKEVVVEFSVPAGYVIGGYLDNGITILKDYAVISWVMQVKNPYPPRGFAVFDLKSGKQVFSSPGTIARFSANHDFFSVGYVQDNLYHVLLENRGSFKKLTYADYNFHTLDSDEQRLFLFGVDKILVVNLSDRTTNQVKLSLGGYDKNSQAVVLLRANLFVDNLSWWSIPGIRFLNLNSLLNEGKSDPVRVLPLLEDDHPFLSFMFSPNGRFFATQSNGFIRVWAVVPEDAPVR